MKDTIEHLEEEPKPYNSLRLRWYAPETKGFVNYKSGKTQNILPGEEDGKQSFKRRKVLEEGKVWSQIEDGDMGTRKRKKRMTSNKLNLKVLPYIAECFNVPIPLPFYILASAGLLSIGTRYYQFILF